MTWRFLLSLGTLLYCMYCRCSVYSLLAVQQYMNMRRTNHTPSGQSTGAGKCSCRRRELTAPSLSSSPPHTSREVVAASAVVAVAASGGRKPSRFRYPIISNPHLWCRVTTKVRSCVAKHTIHTAAPLLLEHSSTSICLCWTSVFEIMK